MGDVLSKAPVSVLLGYAPARSFILADSGFLPAASSAVPCTRATAIPHLVSGALQATASVSCSAPVSAALS